MKKISGTYYKALLLLTVFSLNTMVSFACSFSDLFHAQHHAAAAEKLPAASHHAEGSQQHTHPASGATTDHHSTGATKGADDCCSSFVVTAEQHDKSVAPTITAPQSVWTELSLVYDYILSLPFTSTLSTNRNWVRWQPPDTIPDLRIVIQSFQI